MLQNKEFYSKLPKANDELFTPRPVSNLKMLTQLDFFIYLGSCTLRTKTQL